MSTETRILEAAHRIFLRHGTAGARMQDIADEAGVNRALLHYYFRSKDKLSEAVFIRAARALFPRMLQTLAADLPLREKLHRVVEIELDLLSDNPYLPGYVIAEFQYRHDALRSLLGQVVSLERIRTVVIDRLQRQLDEEAEAGRMRPARAEDFIVMLMAQLIFPFAAAPMLHAALGLDAQDRAEMIDRHRQGLADAMLRSFAP